MLPGSSVPPSSRVRFIRASLHAFWCRGGGGECRGALGRVPRRELHRIWKGITNERKVLIYITLAALESARHVTVSRQQPAGGDVSISLPVRSTVLVFECE